jgi:hypothetical protein
VHYHDLQYRLLDFWQTALLGSLSLAATAESVEEIKHVASLGYRKFDEFQGVHVFNKPKKFIV